MEQFAINPESFRSRMSIPPKMLKQHELAVRAGLRLMFDDGMREETLAYMDGSQGIPQKIGEGIAAVVEFIAQQSNGTFPGELVIPVGVELIAHAVEVAQKAGMEVSSGNVAEGMATFVEVVLKKSGATPEQMQQILGGIDSGQTAQED